MYRVHSKRLGLQLVSGQAIVNDDTHSHISNKKKRKARVGGFRSIHDLMVSFSTRYEKIIESERKGT